MKIHSTVKRVIEQYQTRDPFDIARQMGIVVFYDPFNKSLRGYYATSDDLQAIHINQYLSPEHMRQVCAHEIGHAIMHPLDNTTFIRANTLFMPSKCELEANQFMVCLLYDIDEVIQQAKNGITISQLATAYDIRPEYMEYVLRSHQSEENQCL